MRLFILLFLLIILVAGCAKKAPETTTTVSATTSTTIVETDMDRAISDINEIEKDLDIGELDNMEQELKELTW